MEYEKQGNEKWEKEKREEKVTRRIEWDKMEGMEKDEQGKLK